MAILAFKLLPGILLKIFSYVAPCLLFKDGLSLLFISRFDSDVIFHLVTIVRLVIDVLHLSLLLNVESLAEFVTVVLDAVGACSKADSTRAVSIY